MNAKKILKAILPPILVNMINSIRRVRDVPQWYTIRTGLLEGCEMFIYLQDPASDEMIQGIYEDFLWSYLFREHLEGCTICDIGGHIGYHSLAFANLVGDEGRVIVFEPNKLNCERLNKNLLRNKELAKRINFRPLAVSDFDGETQFHFSSNFEEMASSGGYLEGSYRPLKDEVYDELEFIWEKVIVTKLDNLLVKDDIRNIAVVKIDVEGAEHKVLAGATEILKENHPILLIEIHTVAAMLEVCRMLIPLGYAIEMLKEEGPSRCFIAASYQPQ